MKNIITLVAVSLLSLTASATEVAHVKVSFKKLCSGRQATIAKVVSDHHEIFNFYSPEIILNPGNCKKKNVLPQYEFIAKIPRYSDYAQINLRENRVLGFAQIGDDIAYVGARCPDITSRVKCLKLDDLINNSAQVSYQSDYVNMVVEFTFVGTETTYRSSSRLTP